MTTEPSIEEQEVARKEEEPAAPPPPPPAQLRCQYCRCCPARIGGMQLNIGKMKCIVFFCPACGSIHNIQALEFMQNLVVDPTMHPLGSPLGAPLVGAVR